MVIERFGLCKLDKEDEQLRFDIIMKALDLIELEKIDVPVFSDDQVVDFALEWSNVNSDLSRIARRLFSYKVEGITGLKWVQKNYSISRLRVMYDFSEYCDWIMPDEIIQHFKDVLKVFMALEGVRPSWCSVPFHLFLQVAYTKIFSEHRTKIIIAWLSDNWEEATDFFENNRGTLASFPWDSHIEVSHIFTQYKRFRE